MLRNETKVNISLHKEHNYIYLTNLPPLLLPDLANKTKSIP